MILFRNIDESLLYIFIIFNFLEDEYNISTFIIFIFHIFNNYLIFKRQFLKDILFQDACEFIILLFNHIVKI